MAQFVQVHPSRFADLSFLCLVMNGACRLREHVLVGITDTRRKLVLIGPVSNAVIAKFIVWIRLDNAVTLDQRGTATTTPE